MNLVSKLLVVVAAGVLVHAAASLTPPLAGPARSPPDTPRAPRVADRGEGLIGAIRPVHRSPTPSPPAAAGPGAGLRSQVAQLRLRGSERDAFRAYAVLAGCVQARDLDRFVMSLPAGAGSARLRERYGDGSSRVARACGDLSAGDLDQRIALAAMAADAGVPGAASAWVAEGPFGDRSALTQRPDDPLVVEWAQQAIARIVAATKRSDIEAIGQFGALCLNWQLDDVARVRLLVEAAVEERREAQLGGLGP